PAAALVIGSLVTGRGLIAMWGYPLWLFLGLWIVLRARVVADSRRLSRVVAVCVLVNALFAAAFIVNYTVMQHFDHRYRAAFFPGERLATEIAARYRAATGHEPRYVIARMWEGGNIAHYAPAHPRVLTDGNPRRAPWINL